MVKAIVMKNNQHEINDIQDFADELKIPFRTAYRLSPRFESAFIMPEMYVATSEQESPFVLLSSNFSETIFKEPVMLDIFW